MSFAAGSKGPDGGRGYKAASVVETTVAEGMDASGAAGACVSVLRRFKSSGDIGCCMSSSVSCFLEQLLKETHTATTRSKTAIRFIVRLVPPFFKDLL